MHRWNIAIEPDPCSAPDVSKLQAMTLFVRIVDLGSFSKAATDAGIGQPSATKTIAQREKQLGSRLLH